METASSRRNDAPRKSIFLCIVLSKKAALKPPFKLLKIDKNKKSAFLEATHTTGSPLLRSWASLSCAGF
jgi:hypothetical protein